MGVRRLRQLFADRFEPRGDGFVYRDGVGAPGIVISAAEHARAVTDFEAKLPLLRWICSGWAVLVALLAANQAGRAAHSTLLGLAVFGLLLTPSVAIYVRAMGAPGRALAGRPTIDAGLSRAAAWRRRVGATRWRRILFDVAAGALVLRLDLAGNGLSRVDRIGLSILAGVALVAALAGLATKARQAARRD